MHSLQASSNGQPRTEGDEELDLAPPLLIGILSKAIVTYRNVLTASN